jgi:hypothetical protein
MEILDILYLIIGFILSFPVGYILLKHYRNEMFMCIFIMILTVLLWPISLLIMIFWGFLQFVKRGEIRR